MSSIDSEKNGRDTPTGGEPGDGPAATPAVGGPSAFPPSPARLRGLALAAGLGAGFVAWLGGEAAHGYFRPAMVIVYVFGVPKPNVTPATQAVADGKNAAAAFGMLGATLGLALGLVGGRARRSARAGMRAALVGGALGGALGAATAGAMPILDFRLRDPLSISLALPLLLHSGIAAAVGAAGGLAFGLGLGGRGRAARAAAGGLLGGVLGAVLYEIVGGLAFPLAQTVHTIPVEWGARLVDRLLIATFAAAGAALVADGPGGGPEPEPLLEDSMDRRTGGSRKARINDAFSLSPLPCYP